MPYANTYIKDAIEVFDIVKSDEFEYDPTEEEYGTIIDDWGISEDFVRDWPGCDEFALACRALLKQRGWTPHLVFCKDVNGEGNLICLAGTMALAISCGSATEFFDLTENYNYDVVAFSGIEPEDGWNMVDTVRGDPLNATGRGIIKYRL